jgi:hypothetical protein
MAENRFLCVGYEFRKLLCKMRAAHFTLLGERFSGRKTSA